MRRIERGCGGRKEMEGREGGREGEEGKEGGKAARGNGGKRERCVLWRMTREGKWKIERRKKQR